MIDKITSLTPTTRQIICDKATEYPFTGKYNNLAGHGSYLCRRCGLALFRASSQFASSCGWPSFDDQVLQTIKQVPDADGQRTEILCERCEGHLGHIFVGEHYTQKNQRYCVNAASLDFVVDNDVLDTEEAIVAGGCFWGVQYFMARIPGALKTEVGYTGSTLSNPTYEQVCHGDTGHYEAIRIIYDIAKTDYQTVLKHFFEIHDPTQRSGQGPDIGQQYQSAVFYYNKEQQTVLETLVQMLNGQGYKVATRLLPVQIFWPAEEYHQDYYTKQNKQPYCHKPTARFKVRNKS